tara:strand:+ start:668 stop:874 length:207 start_codon:yes stop_codon:yes gene_type:complete
MGILKSFEENPSSISKKGVTPEKLSGALKNSTTHTNDLLKSFDGQLDLDGKTPETYLDKLGGIKSGNI